MNDDAKTKLTELYEKVLKLFYVPSELKFI